MFDQGPHVVLRRDGVCLVLKTPEGEMPQVEYWGGDFGITSDESALNQLDAMTLKVTPPQEKPDAALRPSLLPQGAEAFAGRPGLDAYRGGKPVFVRWASVTVSPIAAGGETEANTLNIVAEDAVNAVKLELKLSIKKGGLVLVEQTVTNIDATDNPDAAALTVNWLESTLPMPRRADTLTQFTGRWPLEKQPRTAVMPSGSVTRECRHGKTSHESPWMFIASDGEPKCRKAKSGPVISHGAATKPTASTICRRTSRSSALANCSDRVRFSWPPANPIRLRKCASLTPQTALTVWPPVSIRGCAPCRSMCRVRVRSRLTRGRRVL